MKFRTIAVSLGLLFSAASALPQLEDGGLPGPAAFREASKELAAALVQAGFRSDSIRVQRREEKALLAVELNATRWNIAMRSECPRKLALSLWAFGFRHPEGIGATPFSLTKEIASAADLDEVRRLSAELREGAQECAEQAQAKTAAAPEPKPDAAPAAPAPVPTESFAELAARSRSWPLAKRLVPIVRPGRKFFKRGYPSAAAYQDALGLSRGPRRSSRSKSGPQAPDR